MIFWLLVAVTFYLGAGATFINVKNFRSFVVFRLIPYILTFFCAWAAISISPFPIG